MGVMVSVKVHNHPIQSSRLGTIPRNRFMSSILMSMYLLNSPVTMYSDVLFVTVLYLRVRSLEGQQWKGDMSEWLQFAYLEI